MKSTFVDLKFRYKFSLKLEELCIFKIILETCKYMRVKMLKLLKNVHTKINFIFEIA